MSDVPPVDYGSPDDDEAGESSSEPSAAVAAADRRRRWRPDASTEAAAALRLLAVRPWLVAGRDDSQMAAVRRNLPAMEDALARLGWVLVVERDFMRLRKSPPPRRAWADEGPSPLQASWFFLLVAAAETVPPRVGLGQLVCAARAAAAEAALPVTHEIAERRAIVRALKMLDERGVVMQVDGDVDCFVDDEDAPVLLAVYHSRVAHVIANFGPGDPVRDPSAWLERLEREPDAARRMRRQLVDDTVVYAADLDDKEADWLSRRVRGDDGLPLATAFGLHLERRVEGAAFVVPDLAFRYLHELGPSPFPSAGTVPHAALLLCEFAARSGTLGAMGAGPDPSWRGLLEADALAHLSELAAARANGQGGWKRELAENPALLAEDVRKLLTAVDLLRVRNNDDGAALWWFSPTTERWTAVEPAPRPRGQDERPRQTSLFDDGNPAVAS